MSHHYSAHAIIGFKIDKFATMLRELEKKHMLATMGCDKTDCQAKKLESVGMKFCSDCGKPSISRELPDDKCTDDYLMEEWLDALLKDTDYTYVTNGDYWNSAPHRSAYDNTSAFIGVGCKTGYSGIDGNMDGHMDIEHLKCASNSQLALGILLEEALEGLWKGELKGEPFCLWVVLK